MSYEEVLKAINSGELEKAKTLCKQGIETETARTTRGAGEATRIKNIFKLAKRVGSFGTWIEQDKQGQDKLCLCDGYVGYILPMIEGIEPSPKRKSFSLLETYYNARNNSNYEQDYHMLAQLKSNLKQFKADKANKDKTCLTLVNRTCYKVEQLIEAFNVLGIKSTHIYAPTNAKLEPLYISSNNGDVIIMPCRPPKA